MLLQLEITNIALIEHVSIEFKEGLNVLTGETGAGKSIIIDSINALLGGRVTRELIRTGCESAAVSAVYNFKAEKVNQLLEENGIEPEEDGTIIVSREFSMQGKNICRVNGKVVPLSFLKQIGGLLIDVHGQHDNQSLLDVSTHIELLDAFGGDKLSRLRNEYESVLSKYKEKRAELNKLTDKAKERNVRLDMLKYQILEIEQAKLKDGEEEELLLRKNILNSAEKIKSSLSAAYEKMYEGSGKMAGRDIEISAYDLICDSEKDLSDLSKIDERYEKISEKAKEIAYQLYDVIEEIRNEKDSVDFEPGEIEDIEDRLVVINELKRKYGKDISEILARVIEMEEEYQKLFDFEESSKYMEEEIEQLQVRLIDIAKKMTDVRQECARELEPNILKHFEDLEMKNSKFKVEISPASDFMPDGMDEVQFLVSTNLGEPLKPLAKVASGGEMSRIMLSIKAMLAKYDRIPTLIFDEIDVGISGTAAAKVGEKMSMLSTGHQILCVTHIARIAAYADNNILIEKGIEGENTKTYIKTLEGDDLVLEIARLLDGGNISETTKQHAREMLG